MKTNRIALFSLFTLLLLISSIFIYGIIKIEKTSYNTALTLELEQLSNPEEIIHGCTYVEQNPENYLVKVNNKILFLPVNTTKIVYGSENSLTLYGSGKKIFKIVTQLNESVNNEIKLNNLSTTLILNNHDCIHYIFEGKITPKTTSNLYEFKKISTNIYFTIFTKKSGKFQYSNTKRIDKEYGFNKYKWVTYIQNNGRRYKNNRDYILPKKIPTIIQKQISNTKKNTKI